ncbi:hypothetical protein EVA23_06760 [bacterium]|nr:MAG: hypothetical protein EVA23_06760 [bacterium]
MKSKILFFITILLFLSSCTMVNHSVSTPIIYLSDLNVSDEVWGQAKSTKVLGIDFQRLLKRNIESANVGLSTTSIPIFTVGNIGAPAVQTIGISIIDTESLALNDLLNKNKEYDVLISPKFSKTTEGFWPIYWTETVMVKARIGTIK